MIQLPLAVDRRLVLRLSKPRCSFNIRSLWILESLSRKTASRCAVTSASIVARSLNILLNQIKDERLDYIFPRIFEPYVTNIYPEF